MNVMQEIQQQYRNFINKSDSDFPDTVYLSEDCFYSLVKQHEYFSGGQIFRDIENPNKHTVMGMTLLIAGNCREYVHVTKVMK